MSNLKVQLDDIFVPQISMVISSHNQFTPTSMPALGSSLSTQLHYPSAWPAGIILSMSSGQSVNVRLVRSSVRMCISYFWHMLYNSMVRARTIGTDHGTCIYRNISMKIHMNQSSLHDFGPRFNSLLKGVLKN